MVCEGVSFGLSKMAGFPHVVSEGIPAFWKIL